MKPRLVVCAAFLSCLLSGAHSLASAAERRLSPREAVEADRKRPDDTLTIQQLLANGKAGMEANDPEVVRYWYLRAAQKGDRFAQGAIGLGLLKGMDPAQHAEGIQWLTKAASQGLEEAMEVLTAHFLAENNETQALYWARKWKRSDDVPALRFMLAEWLAQGDRVKPDPARALKMMMALAEQGYAPACSCVGVYYLQGVESMGVPRDWPEAERWLIKAADGGDDNAVFLLRAVYGGDQQPDENKLRALLSRRSAAGQVTAKALLGEALVQGAYGFPKDPEAGLRLLRAAAEGGSAVGKYTLGRIYFEGRGAEKNREEGLKWLQAAADANWTEAQSFLGRAYFKGEGSPRI